MIKAFLILILSISQFQSKNWLIETKDKVTGEDDSLKDHVGDKSTGDIVKAIKIAGKSLKGNINTLKVGHLIC